MSDETPQWPRIEGPLDEVNADFHDAYDKVRSASSEGPPVLILLGESLIVHLRGKRREHVITPRLYHALKSASHSPLALYSVLYSLGDAALDAKAAQRLGAIKEHTRRALDNLESDFPHDEARAELRPLLTASLAFIERTVLDGRAGRSALAAFARACGPALLRLTENATELQLEALHAKVEEVLAEMTAAERRALQVVVAGAHQARQRSLAMQYFRKRLHEPDGAEERVAYAENAADEEAALQLVGTRRFDRDIARDFFGDEKRLQRDVLGDAAAARLDTIRFSDDT